MQNKKTILLLLCLFLFALGYSQNVTISGYIEDQETGEKLIAANIFDLKSGQGTVTNNFGFFSLTLPKDSVFLTFSYIGYQPKELKLDLKKNITLNIELSSDLVLDAVEVVAERVEKIEEQTQMSKVDVPVELIKKVPTLFGEVDVLKTLQLLPGVQSGGEGQTGLYVRGGSPDQNLILLDGVPVYNVSHLLGIFSVFNADAIKTVTLTKGGFPARFGGRLSSVLEINMKDGHKEKIHGEGSIGIISSKFTLEGPIVKDKTTFLVSARRTYWDLLARPLLRSATSGIEDTKVDGTLYFYDANAKVTHKINDNNRLFLSFYSGSDIFRTDIEDTYDNNTYESQFGLAWGNVVTALRWNHQFTPKLFLNSTVTYSNYDLKVKAKEKDTFSDTLGIKQTESFAAIYKSGIKDLSGKLDFDYIPNPNHYVRFGSSVTNHIYSPGALNFKYEGEEEFNVDTTFGEKPISSIEFDSYVEDDMKFGAFKMNVGLHFSAFKPKDVTYLSLQPRIGLRYLLPAGYALKGSFTTMTQYLNLLASESFSLPSDLWVPSTKNVVPQKSWQTALGVAKSFGGYEFSVEGFYKQMKNVVSYLPGESFLTGLEVLDGGEQSTWEDKITQGDGESYGAEVFLQKKKGKTTGWIGYTLSWNWRQYDRINGGKRFPFKYDRRHDISIVVTHQFNKHISASATWVFGTGNAISLPESKIPEPGTIVDKGDNYFGWNSDFENPGEKNKYRMTNFHRLDLGINFTKKKKYWTRTWSIGVYNAYFHKNPYFVTRTKQRDITGKVSKTVFSEVSILPFLPSISYSFKF